MSNPARDRPWRRMVLAILLLAGVLFAVAFWSQREDARRLPPERLESNEVTTPP